MAKSNLMRTLKRAIQHMRQAERLGMSDAEYAERMAGLPGRISRRRLLRNSALALAAAPLVPALGMTPASATEDSELSGGVDRKIEGALIIGGGAAGLAAGFQLHRPRKDQNGQMIRPVPFTLIEGSQRWGGRVFTKENFIDRQFVEMGGELVDTEHEMIFRLCKWLGLELEEFSTGETEGLADTLYHFGNRVFDHEQITREVRPLVKYVGNVVSKVYTTKAGEEYDGYLTYHAKNKLTADFGKYDQMTLKDFLASAPGSPWMRMAIEVAYLGEYGLDTDQQSALNLTELFDDDLEDGFSMYGASDEAFRIKGGSSQLINGLKTYLEGLTNPYRDKAEFIRGHMLTSIHQVRDGSLRCTFGRPSGGELNLVAENVICTVPFSTLKNVDMDTLAISKVKRSCIDQMGYGTNSKVLLGFKNTFWRKPELLNGFPASKGEIYGDFRSASYWESSRLQGGDQRRGVLTNYLGGSEGLAAGLNHKGRPDQGARSVSLAIDDLGKMFGPLAKEQFIKDRFLIANWSRVFGGFQQGSYTCLLPGQYGSIWGAAGEAELEGRLLFAGEHTSLDFWGYMNGAYDSGYKTARTLRNRLHNQNRI